MAKQSFLIPLGIFVGLIVILGVGFTLNDPKLLPSAKIGQPFLNSRFRISRIQTTTVPG